MDSPSQDRRQLWCPHLNSRELFWYEVPGMEEEIFRYPAVLGTDEFFQETENESSQTNSDLYGDTGSGGWFGVLNTINAVRFWESPAVTDDNNTMNWDEESSEDEEGDEHWSRPPPINTDGPEWFYE